MKDSPYLTLEEGARFAKFDVTAPKAPVECFRQWLIRKRIPLARRGRRVLVKQTILEAYLDGEKWTTR